MKQTRRTVLKKILRKLASPQDLRKYLVFKLVSGDEYPYLDFTDFFPRTASVLGKFTQCKLDVDSPVFIAGLRRSGSTLFYRIMNANSELFMFNERFPGDRMNGRGISSTSNIYYTVEDPQEFYDITLRYLSPAIRRNYQHWGAKLALELAHPHPGSIAYPTMEKIVAAFPQARIIGLTRDPRDFVISALNRGGHDINWWVREYNAMMTLFSRLQEDHPDIFTAIRYEDLVEQPAQTIHKCCEFAELPFEDGMLDASQWSAKGPREYASTGIVARTDKWRNATGMDQETVKRVVHACFPHATRFGYQQD